MVNFTIAMALWNVPRREKMEGLTKGNPKDFDLKIQVVETLGR